MSGDLEDFLRRAAQRRQAKAAQQQQQKPAPRQRPQYSDRRAERVVFAEPEEILTAEIVEEEDPNSYAARLRRVEEAKQAAARAEAEIAKRQGTGRPSKASGVAAAISGNPTQELLAMLRQPGGIQQAILLREILDRPEHRW